MVREKRGWLLGTPSTPDVMSNSVNGASVGSDRGSNPPIEQRRLIVVCPGGGDILDIGKE